MEQIWSIPEAVSTSKFFKISSTVVVSTFWRAKYSYSLRIYLSYSVVLIPNLFFGHAVSAKLEKNLQNLLAFSFELSETTSFSFKWYFRLHPALEDIPRDFKVRHSSFELFLLPGIFLQSKVFSCYQLLF